MSKVSTKTRRELVATIRGRYRSASPVDKQRILDEFVALTGCHRKHAIRVLSSATNDEQSSATPPRERIYGEAVREAVGMLWEAADRVCGKRLKPLLPILVTALERHGHLTLDPAVRERLLAASAATLDRLLTARRAQAGGQRRRPRTKSAASQSIPVRTFADWKEPEPGFLEIDLVAHCGDNIGGSYAHTLTLTDVASGWTECVALMVRESTLVVDALDRLRKSMPFPLRGIDTDNGSEFINEALVDYCSKQGIVFTRSRPYRKNDQAWIEQKNGSVVRRLVGYGRRGGLEAADRSTRAASGARSREPRRGGQGAGRREPARAGSGAVLIEPDPVADAAGLGTSGTVRNSDNRAPHGAAKRGGSGSRRDKWGVEIFRRNPGVDPGCYSCYM
jgi:hypothetical protein